METPFFLMDEARLRRNLALLGEVREQTGCLILLALKGFAMWRVFPLLREMLDGTCASSPWEARLGREEFGGLVHAFAAAYSERDFNELLATCDALDFNSFAQRDRFMPLARGQGVQFGLRINPERSTQPPEHALYDPCAPRSRLGILRREFEGQSLEGISGLHFHTLCEQNADALALTLEAVEAKFGEFLPRMEWVNFGGGHHITRSDYDRTRLCGLIRRFKERYGVQVILEPGEAVALNTGILVATVLDITENGGQTAVLDVSCTCHMPDVLEMPYRPQVALAEADDEGDALFAALENENARAGGPEEGPHRYRLAGLSCLAGDVVGDYSFHRPLQPGNRLVFGDMAHYSMVKTTFFNGIRHPAIALLRNGEIETVREFEYADYKNRLS